MKTKKIILSFLVFFLVTTGFLFLIESSFAQSMPNPQECKSGLVPCGRSCDNANTGVDETKPCTLCHLIIGFWNLVNYAFRIMVYVGVTALVVAGILYIVSAGNEQMISTAKAFIKHILMGFAVVLLAWVMIFSVMRYFLVKSDLGINKTEGWTKFECSTDTASPTNPNPNSPAPNPPTNPNPNP